jgi:putative tryptophan/tyrosine transport system substrate-binding protein
MRDLNRRGVIGLVGGAAAWPVMALAQAPKMPLIGFVNGQRPREFAHLVTAFHQGLGETGYVEGQNVAIEYRWAEGQETRMPALIDDLVRLQVAVLVISGSGQGILAARAVRSTVPMVVSVGIDPVKSGLVASLNRPGGHITAVSVFTTTMEAKRLDLLHQAFPRAELIGVLVDPAYPGTEVQLAELQAAAAARAFPIVIFNASTESELETAFVKLSEARVSAITLAGNPFFNSKRSLLVALSARHAMPTMFEARQFAEAGGLMSYGPNISEVYRQIGVYAGRILKGEKAGDLPVMQPTRFDFVINLKTAKTLGLELPPTLLALADEVIE